MEVLIAAVGHKMPAWVEAAVLDYQERLPRELRLRVVNVKPRPRRAGLAINAVLEQEAHALRAAVGAGSAMVVLDEAGESLTSAQFAAALRAWLTSTPRLAFVIGGADGTHEQLKRTANRCLSLSALTLPHALARVVLIEQIYRAACILKGHPYHRG